MIFKIAIVEDDKKQQENTINILKKYAGEHSLLFSYNSFENGFNFLDNYKAGLYDIVFMDINMPGINGLEASKELRKIDSDVILLFVTDFAQFAIRGYEVDAYDFIVKPISYEHLSLKFDRLIPNLKKRNEEVKINLKNGNQILSLNVDEIIYVEVKSHDTVIHCEDKEYCVRIPLSNIEEQLPKDKFYRCNHCYIINFKYVGKIDKYQLIMSNGEELTISHPKKKAFMSALMNYLGEPT